MKKTGCLLTLLCLAGMLFAQTGKIDTDRPDQTESAGIVPNHYFQGEFGFNREILQGKDYDLVHPTGLLKYGLKKMEFRLEFTYRSAYEHPVPQTKRTTGLDPVEIGFKTALWPEKKLLPKTSLIVHLGLPTIASKAFRADHLFPSFRFTMQHTLTEHTSLSYNLGAEWDGFTSTPAWLYTFSPGFDLGEKWYAYIEAFGFIRKDGPPEHSLDGGIAYYLNPDIKLDVSGGFGISKAAPDHYYALGFSFRFNTKK